MDVRELKDSAADYFRKGKFSKAAEAYLALSRAEPKETQHLIKLGDSFRRDGRKEPAIEAYRRAVGEYARQGIVIKAIAACKLILEIDPSQKDAQEQLANLCAKRYVRRDNVDTPPPESTRPHAREYMEAIELPEDDTAAELETFGAPMPAAQRPSAREPVRPLPPIAARPASRPPVAAPPPSRVPPMVSRVVPEDPDAIDLDFGDSLPPQKPAFAPPPSRPTAQSRIAAIDLIEVNLPETEALDELPADALVEEADEEFPSGIAFVTAESTGEHEVLRSAEEAAGKPSTAMASILADSLLVQESDELDDDEEELLSVTAGQATPPPASAVIALDPLVPAPPTAARQRSPEEITAEQERADARQIANELAFDPSDDAGLVPPEAPVREPTRKPVRPPPLPAMPLGDVDQRSVPLFSELPKEAFLELLEKLHFRRFAKGEAIINEGETGQSIYVLASGAAKVIKGHGTPKPLELAELSDGAFFGEMALLNGAPRVASVVASDDCEVLEITEGLLRDLTRKHSSVAQSLKKFYRQRLLANVMAISPLFRAFDRSDRKMLVEKFKLREVAPGEAIISEGARPDGLYVIMHGAALVSKTDAESSRAMPLAMLKEGDVFGEMSLLTKKPASATVTAKRRTLVLRLPKPVFDELMFTHPQVLEVVSELTDQRSRVNEQILGGQVAAPHEALALV